MLVRPGTEPEDRESFAEWALGLFTRFYESGPDGDGWGVFGPDGPWQLWATKQWMPEIDIEWPTDAAPGP
jgi:hypothetical protein